MKGSKEDETCAHRRGQGKTCIPMKVSEGKKDNKLTLDSELSYFLRPGLEDYHDSFVPHLRYCRLLQRRGVACDVLFA